MSEINSVRPTKKVKRNEESTTNSLNIVQELPKLRRKQLEAIAEAAIKSCDKAKLAASKVLHHKSSYLQHCVRCHEDFDPDVSSSWQCITEGHDTNNGMIETGNNYGKDWLYPCCLKYHDSEEPCWIGRHLLTWNEFTPAEEPYLVDRPSEDYWNDKNLAEKWSRQECVACAIDDPYCIPCCTCDDAEEEEE